VDFCSGALLLTPRDLFLALGRFDERYAPAYYEDADYCMSLRANGYRTVCQPGATVVHHEFGSAPRREGAIAAQVKNQRLFVEKWAAVLRSHLPPSLDNVLLARDAGRRPRLLFVDDRVPDPRLGSGFPRTHGMLISLRELGWAVTFFALQDPERVEPCTSELETLGIEMIIGPAGHKPDLKRFLESRPNHYDVVLISRPHNMREVLPFVREAAPDAKLVYDAEAIYAKRELQRLRLDGATVDGALAAALVREEMSLVRPADAVIAASAGEARTFEEFGVPGAHVVGHRVQVRPTMMPFSERRDLLFVGAVLASPSPNEDAVLYFVREVLPLIRRRIECTFFVVGTNRSRAIAALQAPAVRIVGAVDDLAPWYARARAFVVPTRYAAGIPIKLYEASAFGLPSVVTPLIVHQVGWTPERDLLVGADPETLARRVVELHSDESLWERIRLGALSAIERDCSEELFRAGLLAATAPRSTPVPEEGAARARLRGLNGLPESLRVSSADSGSFEQTMIPGSTSPSGQP
jgi:glycosyltransferase involved in cell wall biosynthesis